MRKFFMTLLFASVLSACDSHTAYGDCIGVDDDEVPTLVYKVSTWNVIMGIIFIETIVVPVVVVLDEVKCPVGHK